MLMRKPHLILLLASVLAPPGIAQDSKLSRAQLEVVEAERAFARYCVQNGVRAAWLEFFADDGIIFQPGPVNAKDFHGKRPIQAMPPKVVLNWEPRYGDVSQAGDLAYNVGPWNLDVSVDPKVPTEHGYYMSIWMKQPDGKWKVALDFGSGKGAPATADHEFGKPFQAARQYKITIDPGTHSTAELQALETIDRDLQKNSMAVGALDAYRSLIADEAKIMRAAQAPADRQSVSSFIPAARGVSLAFDPAGGAVSTSSDLGYTYGSYELQVAARTREQGYYAHVFKRNPAGRWQIVVSNIEAVK